MSTRSLASVLLLASSSPRRSDLLRQASIEFLIVVPGDEPRGAGTPLELAEQRAVSKALGARVEAPAGGSAGQGRWPSDSSVERGVLLGVDTVVDVAGEEFGKPRDAADARRMIGRLVEAGRHRVHSVSALAPWSRAEGVDPSRLVTVRSSAEVRFETLEPSAIDSFVATDSWRGKAGGYGIQDVAGAFARCAPGDFDTVVGLAVAPTVTAYRQLLAKD